MDDKSQIHQIQIQKLLFTQNWEDPDLDRQALSIMPGEKMMTITSGGCNTLSFLLQDPEIIYSVDINASQKWLMELKMESIRKLKHEQMLQFFGLSACDDRLKMYAVLRPGLSTQAQIFWDAKQSILKKGFLTQGRFENFVKLAGKLVKFVQGKKRLQDLLKDKSQEEQQQYYDRTWNTRRMRLIFSLLFNKRVLARRGLKADYFHFDDGSDSFAENFYGRLRKALRNIPLKGNYFTSMYLLGKYRRLNEVPDYLLPEHFPVIQNRLDRIRLIQDDAKKWLASMPDESIDCFALSNICELMSLDDTEKLFKEVVRTSKTKGRICFRNLMIPREVPSSLQHQIRKNEPLSQALLASDRSFVYSKVAAYKITK